MIIINKKFKYFYKIKKWKGFQKFTTRKIQKSNSLKFYEVIYNKFI